jgi:hypothetical protein
MCLLPAGCILSFTIEEGELPELVGPHMIIDMFGGKGKVKYVDIAEVR